MASSRDTPDLDAEREVDLRRHWETITERWWLVLGGLAAGLVIGYLIALGGEQVYKARAVVYVGQPLSASGVQVQSQNTNPSSVREIALANATIDSVASRVGLKPSQLRGHVSVQAVSGAITRLGQNPLMAINVTGPTRGKVAAAANGLATAVVRAPALAHYSDVKIDTLRRKVNLADEQIKQIDAFTRQLQSQIRNSSGASELERLILANQLNGNLQQRLQIADQQASDEQLLTLAEQVEAPQLITRAVSSKTTARSRRNTVLVAGLIGLLLGGAAALLYEPALKAVRSRS
jgi:subunit length determinant Wzz-like protein